MATRIVIAEDEALIRLDLKETLEAEGYEVVGAVGRGDEAVELVKELHPDLAILDIKMPGMDGITAARQLPRKTKLTRATRNRAMVTNEPYVMSVFPSGNVCPRAVSGPGRLVTVCSSE